MSSKTSTQQDQDTTPTTVSKTESSSKQAGSSQATSKKASEEQSSGKQRKAKVLITGAAGSLGKAFVRHIKDLVDVIAIDNNEWAVAEFRQEFPDVTIRLKDYITELPAVDVVIHCAAYKHVDLAESNPDTFVENNLVKYLQMLRNIKARRLLFISTDKAVQPVSTYGFTKALGEKLTLFYGGQVARLGNILNSSGSVIPVWEQAIKNKQPIKVTDKRMKRYVIEEDDAVKQIWDQFLAGNRLIIPKMGEPKPIMDILDDVLKKHGYEKGEDYEPGIEYIGARPGERLVEPIVWQHELPRNTKDENTDNRG